MNGRSVQGLRRKILWLVFSGLSCYIKLPEAITELWLQGILPSLCDCLSPPPSICDSVDVAERGNEAVVK